MIFRLLLLCSVLITVLFPGTLMAQDRSAMWNAAKRMKLGLDSPAPVRPAQPGGITINPDSPPNVTDVAVYTASGNAQSENSIGVNFSNPNQLMVSTNGRIPGSNPVVHQTWAFSTDGGLTWPPSIQSEDNPPNIVDDFGDPVAFFDVSGRAYYCTLGSPGGIYFVTTTNFGGTWSARSNGDNLNSGDDDKQHAAADYSGTFPNNVYVAWTDFGVSGTPIQFARSTNQGSTWQTRLGLPIGANRGQGSHIAIGPNGEVYVFWAHYTGGTAEVGVGLAKSTNGGATFNTPAVAFPISGIRTSNGGVPEFNNVRVNSFPGADADRSTGSRRGWVYVTYSDRTSGNSDILMRRSTDAGTTWSSPITVADQPAGQQQWFPSIAVDPTGGGISISYFNFDSTGGNFLANRYMAYSNDGGNTWDRFIISDVRANYQPQGTPNTNANYNGDYYETAATGGKAWACWTDRRSGTNKAYVERTLYADPVDPNPPSNVVAYSQFSTPTTMALSWKNPATLVNGSPIGPFVMRIKRNGVQITERPGTDSTYGDPGLTTYTQYTYTFQTRLTSNDSLSTSVDAAWTAGGSPYPGTPSNFAVSASVALSTHANLTWTNPTTQRDGTPIHDFGGTIILRNGIQIDSVGPGPTSYQDTPPPGFTHCYSIKAYNTLVPRRYGDPTTQICIFIGSVPDYLVWQPSDVVSPSGDSLTAALTRLGKSNLKRDSLFAFGPNLAQYQGIFVCLGIYTNNHVIGATDPEGAALNTYVSNGGKLYLEGGDCFNYDPESVSGYNLRPIFGLNDGADGGTDVTRVSGRTLLNGLSFSYTGGNNFMDELHPIGGGANVLYTIPNSSPPNDTSAVLNLYGSGRSVAAVPEFGGLVDSAGNKKDSVLSKILQFFNQGVAAPEITITPTSLTDTLQQGGTGSKTFNIANSTPPPSSPLYVGMSEGASWLAVAPNADTLGGNENVNVNLNFDATALAPGIYNTNVVVTSNDGNEPTTNVAVTLHVTGAPVISIRPDSILRTLPTGTTAVETLVIKNTGVVPLTWSVSDLPSRPATQLHMRQPQADELYPPRRGRDGWVLPHDKNEQERYSGPPVLNGSGGPDSAGYRWWDSDTTGGPTFTWSDISGTGMPVSGWIGSDGLPNADDGYVKVPLPFAFTFYGASRSSIKICTNGWVGFDTASTNTEYLNEAIPSSVQPNLTLFPFWDDFDLRTSGTVYHYHDASNAQFIVQYTAVPHYNSGGPYTFQVIIRMDGSILYEYLDMQTPLNSATVGIENNSGTVGLQAVFNNTYMHNSLAILFAKDVSWLSQNPVSGSIIPNDSAKVAVTFNSNGFSNGAYRANISISSNDVAHTPKIVPVKMTVGAGGGGVSIGVPIVASWNMVSNPVSNPVPDDSVRHLYSRSVSNYAFAYSPGLGYQQKYQMSNGTGYWIKSDTGYSQTITGTSRDTLSIAVVAGWNMIGSISVSIDTSVLHVTPTPSNLRGSPYYRYNGGFSIAATIAPGGAYWVKATGTGSFYMHAATPAGESSEGQYTAVDGVIGNLNTVTIHDAQGASQTLYFGGAVSDPIPVPIYSLPPPPPAGAFDARFESEEGGTMTMIHPAHTENVIDMPVVIQSDAYPLSVTWEIHAGSYILSDGSGGHAFGQISMSGTAELRITDPSIHRFVISTEHTEIPAEYALLQNYPNPFNPTTRIEFTLPTASSVRLGVYNILGQEVVTLVKEYRQAGYHTINWNGRDAFGTSISSGMYFYKLDATATNGTETFTTMKKMLLVK